MRHTKLVRLVLTYVNPTKEDIKNVKRLFVKAKNLTESRMYVACPENKLVSYSTTKEDSISELSKLKNPNYQSDAYLLATL